MRKPELASTNYYDDPYLRPRVSQYQVPRVEAFAANPDAVRREATRQNNETLMNPEQAEAADSSTFVTRSGEIAVVATVSLPDRHE